MPRKLAPIGPRRAAKAALPYFDILLNAVHAAHVGRVFTIEVGAGTGDRAPSLQAFYRDDGWSGLLIEPEPRNFAALEASHADSDRVAVLNIAISDTAGTMPLYSLTEDAATRLSAALPLSASLVQDRLLAPGVGPEDLRLDDLPCLRLDVVLEELGIPSVQVLKVNAGGHEGQVLTSLDLGRLDPSLVLVTVPSDTLAERDCLQALARASLVPFRIDRWLLGLAPGRLSLPMEDLLTLFGRALGQVETDEGP